MKKNLQLTILLVVVLLLIAACAKETDYNNSQESVQSSISDDNSETKEEDDTTAPLPEEGEVIKISSSGFSPSTLTISKGTMVTFVVIDDGAYWPASASHPSHTVYPTTGGCIGSTFDACTKLRSGDSWSFTFDETGEWDYHDHLNPGLQGTIIVE